MHHTLDAPGRPDEVAHLQYGISDPTATLYSSIGGAKTPSLNQKMVDAMTAMITGRQVLSDWDQLVKDWRTSGGDEVRADYEKTYTATKG